MNVAPPPSIVLDAIVYGPPLCASARLHSDADSTSVHAHSNRVPRAPRSFRLRGAGASLQFCICVINGDYSSNDLPQQLVQRTPAPCPPHRGPTAMKLKSEVAKSLPSLKIIT